VYRILAFSFAVAIIPLFSQVPATPKPAFEVISIKRTAPDTDIEGFGGFGDRFNVTGGTLRFLLNIYSRANNKPSGDQLRIINAPNWIDRIATISTRRSTAAPGGRDESSYA